MKCGINASKQLSGAEWYVRLFQISSLLPMAYILTVPSYMKIITTDNWLTKLFDGGIACLPRAEALLLSLLYRVSESELAVSFALLGIALAFGLVMKQLLRGKSAKAVRIVLAVCIGTDLVLRLLPLGFNSTFGAVFAILGFAVRLICLLLIILDIIASKKATKTSK